MKYNLFKAAECYKTVICHKFKTITSISVRVNNNNIVMAFQNIYWCQAISVFSHISLQQLCE